MPELEEELTLYADIDKLKSQKQIAKIRNLREVISAEVEKLRADDYDEVIETDRMKQLLAYDVQLKDLLIDLAGNQHRSFHERWGMLFRAGYQSSRFSFYVTNYACLYTSKASNLLGVSNERSFRTLTENAPHEIEVVSE